MSVDDPCQCGGTNTGSTVSVAASSGAAVASIPTLPGSGGYVPEHSTIAIRPIVQTVDLQFDNPPPTTVEVNGVFYDSSGAAPGQLYRVGDLLDPTSLSAGRYPFTLDITEHFTSSSIPNDGSGYSLVAGPSNALMSPGWQIPGIDRLTVSSGGALWQTGGDTLIWFTESSGSYLRPDGDQDLSTLIDNLDGTFTLSNRWGDTQTFNSLGYVIEKEDRNGRKTTFTYTNADPLVDSDDDDILEIESYDGRTLTYSYEDNRISGITDFDGREITFTYDVNDRLETITYPDPGDGPFVVTYTYKSGTDYIEEIDDNGNTTTITYDFAGAVETITDPEGKVKDYQAYLTKPLHDPTNGKGTSKSPETLWKAADVEGTAENEDGDATTYIMGPLGLPLKMIDALGNETTYVRNSDGRVTKETGPDPDGAEPAPVTSYEYTSGNLTKMTLPDGSIRTWTYDSTWIIPDSYTDERGLETLYDIDLGTGWVLETRQVIGEVDDEYNLEEDDIVTSRTYTEAPIDPEDPPAGLVATETDPLGKVTAYEYNARGQVTSTTYAVGTADEATTKNYYNADGTLDYETDELGRRTDYDYDLLGRLILKTLADPDDGGPLARPEIAYEYDVWNRLIKETDPLGRETLFAYDKRGLQTKIERPDHDGDTKLTTTTMVYDDRGLVDTVTDPLGRSTSYTHDKLGRQTFVTLPEVADPSTAVNEIQIIDFDSGTEGTFKLNGNSKTAVVDLDDLSSLQTALDSLWGAGNTKVTYTATEATVTFRGDLSATNVAEMTVSDITGTKGATPFVSTDTAGVAASLVNPVTETHYDALGRVDYTLDARGAKTTYSWEYLNPGQRLTITLPDPDPGASGPGLDPPVLYQEFDGSGNLTKETDAHGNHTVRQYDILGRLIKLIQPDPGSGSPTTEYAYDLAGNLRFITDPLGNTTEYQYDHRHRQVKVISADPDGDGPLSTLVSESKYDDAGQLTSTTAPGDRTTSYEYDGLGRTISVTAPDPDGVGGVSASVTKYAYDAAGQLIAMTDPLNQETAYGYDQLGNQIRVVNADPDGYGPLNSTVLLRAFDSGMQLISESEGMGAYETQRLYFGSESDPEEEAMGQFALTFGGYTANYLDFDASPAEVQAALEALPSIGYGNVLVSGAANGFIFQFRRALIGDVPMITEGGESLMSPEGGIVVNVVQAAISQINEIQLVDFGGATSGTFDISGNSTSATVATLDGPGLQAAIDEIWGFEGAYVSWNGTHWEVSFEIAGDIPEMSISANSTNGSPVISTDTEGQLAQPEIIEFAPTGWLRGGYWEPMLDSVPTDSPVAYDADDYAFESELISSFSGLDVTFTGSWSFTTNYNVSSGTWTIRSYEPDPLLVQISAEIVEVQAGDLQSTTRLYEYDNLGRLITVTSQDPDGGGSATASVTHYSYDLNGNQIGVRDPLQLETTYVYDFLNRRVLSRDALGGETEFTYDANGNLKTLTDPVENTTEWFYDELNRVEEEENQLSHSRFFYYDAAGNLIGKTDRNERVTVYEYDNLHRMVAEEWWGGTRPSMDVSTSTDGSAADEVQRVGFYSGNILVSGTFTLTYDGQTTGTIAFDADEATVQAALEALSNIADGEVSVTKPVDTDYEQMWEITFVEGLSGTDVVQVTVDASSVYDGSGAPSETETTNTEGYTTNEVQVVTLSDTTGGTFRLSYGGAWSAALDWDASTGDVDTALEALSGAGTVSVSGSAGGPYTITFTGDYAGLNIAPLFMRANDLTNADLLRSIDYIFNELGEIESVSDPDATYDYLYDDMGRLTSQVQSITGLNPEIEFTSAYNAASNRTELQAWFDSTKDFRNTYSYDALQRLTTFVQQTASGGNTVAPKRVEFNYNEVNQFTSINRYAATDTSEFVAASYYSYDDMNRLTKLVHSESASAPTSGWGTDPLAGYEFVYDAGSRILSIESYLDSWNEYVHDDTYQLINAQHAVSDDEIYEYDANGNRIMSGYNITANNQLQSDGTYTYTYDAEGNRETRTKISNGHVTRYEWDHRNRLTKVIEEDDNDNVLQVTEHYYDAYNQWIRRQFDDDGDGSNPFTDTFFVYETGQVVLEFDGDDDSDLSHRYAWSLLVDQAIADEQVTTLGSAGQVLWTFGDHLGTIRDLVTYNSSTDDATIANHREWDSYGNLTDQSSVTYVSTIGYTGRMWDITTGLQNNLNRWYDPATGRWISEDPAGFIANDPNLSRYVGSSVLGLIDPSGLFEVTVNGKKGEVTVRGAPMPGMLNNLNNDHFTQDFIGEAKIPGQAGDLVLFLFGFSFLAHYKGDCPAYWIQYRKLTLSEDGVEKPEKGFDWQLDWDASTPGPHPHPELPSAYVGQRVTGNSAMLVDFPGFVRPPPEGALGASNDKDGKINAFGMMPHPTTKTRSAQEWLLRNDPEYVKKYVDTKTDERFQFRTYLIDSTNKVVVGYVGWEFTVRHRKLFGPVVVSPDAPTWTPGSDNVFNEPIFATD